MWEVDRKLWKTANGEIVEDGDPRARILFAVPGMQLPAKPQIKATPQAEDKAVRPVEDKRRTKK